MTLGFRILFDIRNLNFELIKHENEETLAQRFHADRGVLHYVHYHALHLACRRLCPARAAGSAGREPPPRPSASERSAYPLRAPARQLSTRHTRAPRRARGLRP